MPWPLEEGLIVSYFGKQKHPVFGNVETFNNGINIATSENTIIRSIFKGKVSRIFLLKGRKGSFNKSWRIFYSLFWIKRSYC